MIKELIIYIILFILLSFIAHYEAWFDYPLELINDLDISGAYDLDSFHPPVFTLIAYIILLLPRSIIRVFGRIFK